MARKLRIQFEGAIYHVTLRGMERRRLFDDDRDRERFLKRLGEAVEEYGVRLYLFCVMRNHIHLLVETPQGNLSAFMHKLQTAYTVYYNLRHRRAGHLMQGRFGAEPVEGDSYLLRLSRYIHLNPVFTYGMKQLPMEQRVRDLRSYRWSSYRGYAGLEEGHGFVDDAPLLSLTDGPAKRRRQSYARYVEAGLSETDTQFAKLMRSPRWGVGDGVFQARVRDLHTDRVQAARRPEDASFRRVSALLPAETVLEAVGREFGMEVAVLRQRQYACVARAVAALLLGRFAGMNQRDTGGYLGIGTGVSVSLQLKRLRERLARDPSLSQQVTGLVRDLERARERHDNKPNN